MLAGHFLHAHKHTCSRRHTNTDTGTDKGIWRHSRHNSTQNLILLLFIVYPPNKRSSMSAEKKKSTFCFYTDSGRIESVAIQLHTTRHETILFFRSLSNGTIVSNGCWALFERRGRRGERKRERKRRKSENYSIVSSLVVSRYIDLIYYNLFVTVVVIVAGSSCSSSKNGSKRLNQLKMDRMERDPKTRWREDENEMADGNQN